jgi:hypothetical protein
MIERNNVARILVGLGGVALIAVALLHLSDYPKDLGAVSGSNLGARLKGGVRALYFLVGWEWIVIAIIMLMISAFNVAFFKVIVLFCAFALLVTMAVMIAFMGWFVGTYMILASALLILCGGLLFKNTAG